MSSALLSDARWIGVHGIGRFAAEVLHRLAPHDQLTAGPRPLSVADPLWTSWQVLRRRPEVYFSPGFNPPPLCPFPLVFTIHDLLQVDMPCVTTPAKRAYYAGVIRRACRSAYRVLTVSEHSRAAILEWTGLPEQRVVSAGNGVSAPFHPAGARSNFGYRYVLYSGNFRAHKNLERLFAAFRDLASACDVRLVLTGTPGREVSRKIEEYGSPARTVFAGKLPDEALACLYRGAELVVQPSLSEGFGLPALEAMACGTPVVAARAGALPEVTGTAALLVDPLDPGDIRRGMAQVLGDKQLRARMRGAGIARARQFTWEGVAARVRAVLEAAGWNHGVVRGDSPPREARMHSAY